MVKQKVLTAVLTQAESKDVLIFWLALLLLIADFCLFCVENRQSDFPEYMPLVCLNCTFKHQWFWIASRNSGWLEWIKAQQNVLSMTYSLYFSNVCCLSSLEDGIEIECGQNFIHVWSNLCQGNAVLCSWKVKTELQWLISAVHSWDVSYCCIVRLWPMHQLLALMEIWTLLPLKYKVLIPRGVIQNQSSVWVSIILPTYYLVVYCATLLQSEINQNCPLL